MTTNTTDNIQLREIDKTNWKAAARLKLAEGQERYVAPNCYSMLEVMYSDEGLQNRGIYQNDELIGYVMYGADPDTGKPWIVRLMIDKDHQYKGYGRAALHAIIDQMKQRYQCNEIYISFVPDNAVARKLYESIGFEDTGKIDHGELIFKLTLDA